MTEMDEILRRVAHIPKISSNTIQIMSLLARKDYQARELSDMVSRDVSLSAGCLKAVNAARMGLRREVTSIEHAVSYLGSREILNLALAGEVGGVLNTPLLGYCGEREELWAHSLRTAIASAGVCRAMFPEVPPGGAYAAGLLHDIGKVILSEFLFLRMGSVFEEMGKDCARDFLAIEKTVLAHNHTEIGEVVAIQWNLPAVLRTAIRWHHAPASAPDNRDLCLAVHIGDILAMLGGCGSGGDTLMYRVDPMAEELMRKHGDVLPRIMLETETEYSSVRKRLDALAGENDGETHSDRG